MKEETAASRRYGSKDRKEPEGAGKDNADRAERREPEKKPSEVGAEGDMHSRHVEERKDMRSRHEKEHRDIHGQHKQAMRDMFSRHEADMKAMNDRQNGEAAGGDGQGTPNADSDQMSGAGMNAGAEV